MLGGDPVLVDFESRSRANLKVCGGRKYWLDPSSEVLCCVWYDTFDGTVGLWFPGQTWPHPGRVLAAHNVGFDRFAAERYEFRAAGWIDTSSLARKAGLPGALDALGTRWLGVPKDKEASAFTKSLSSVRRPTTRTIPWGTKITQEQWESLSLRCRKAIDSVASPTSPLTWTPEIWAKLPVAAQRRFSVEDCSAAEWRDLTAGEKRRRGALPELTPEAMSRVVAYCISDVEILAHAWPRLRDWVALDADVEALDRIINDRGIYFDRAWAEAILARDAELATGVVASAAAELGWTEAATRKAASSDKQFIASTGAPNAQAATVEALDHPLAQARMAIRSIRAGKLTAGLGLQHDDGRLRDTLRYYGAHTGRFSGRGLQPQNLPRPDKRFEDANPDDWTLDDVRTADADGLDFSLRGVLCAPAGRALVACDLSAIEAVGLAWAAKDEAALRVIREGRELYRVAAGAIFGCTEEQVTKPQRQVGKVSDLACQYGGGPGAFMMFAGNYRLDLDDVARRVALRWRDGNAPKGSLQAWLGEISACDTPDFALHAEVAGVDARALCLREIVDQWRASRPAVRALWRACASAFRSAANGRAMWAGPFEFVPFAAEDGHHVAAFLPSGRCVVYNHARANGSLAYLGTKGVEEHIYGGKLVENLIQAMCRDIFTDAMVATERAGWPIVLTVHDEIVTEVPAEDGPRAYEELKDIMSRPPVWGPDMPVAASGWVGRRYRK